MGVAAILAGTALAGSVYTTIKGQETANEAADAQKRSAQQAQEAASKANSQAVATEGTVSDTSVSRQKKLEALRAGVLSTIKTARGTATSIKSTMPGLKTKLGQ